MPRYERIDGPAPRWRLVFTNPQPGHSETGLRGLTAIPSNAGRQVLLAAVEGDAARLVRIDPVTGAGTTDLDLKTFLAERWGMRAGYVIAAYNDMTTVRDVAGDVLLIGLEAFVPKAESKAPGHSLVDVGYGRVEAGAWYLVRWPDGRHELHQVAPALSRPLVATRTIRTSPFTGDSDTVYFAGYDANKAPAHDTAWIARTVMGTALATSR